MKRVVWANKSNGQLCVTIPKDAQMCEGDFVEINKSSVKRISYIGVVGDLFHFGHLQSIQFSKENSDYNICGVFTDEAVEEYRSKPIANLKERKAVIESLNCVDRVMVQHSRDPVENLKRIREEFPNAEIILVHGDNWKDVPGADYVRGIGGRLLQHPYYARLSTFKIMNKILETKDKHKDIASFTSYIGAKNVGSETENKAIISSKADTLQALRPILAKSRVEEMVVFTVSDWKNDQKKVLQNVMKTFSGKIVVRSSAVNEDTLDQSMAGHFESVLNVDVKEESEVIAAIQKVLKCYKMKKSESSFNQVLVQKQTDEITMSGVVFTRTLEKNAPYYVINYDDKTGSSDSVTSGKENEMMMIAHATKDIPEKMQELLVAVKELEEKIPGIPLDIEFAISKGEVVIFQVRPLAVNMHKTRYDDKIQEKMRSLKEKFKSFTAKQKHIPGETTYFADMPDWNPAEIIGDNPNQLDYSLYDYLITNTAWHEGKSSQGYFEVKPAKLVELFGNKPYVNVRNSFNSYIPAGLSEELHEKLMEFYLEKLRKNPHLQDKVEFSVLYNCYDLNLPERLQELSEQGFSEDEILELQNKLRELTNKLIINGLSDIAKDMEDVRSLEKLRSFIAGKVKAEYHSPTELINFAKSLLDECRKKGTVQFSRLARLGFIGKIIFHSLVNKEVSQEFFDEFYNSISTVATEISLDYQRLLSGSMMKEEFIKKYFHLRPGTYDITSTRYDAHPSLLDGIKLNLIKQEKVGFVLADAQREKITKALNEEGLEFNAQHFLDFLRAATESREMAKFEFSKNLSDALELLAQAGEEMGFTRQEMAMLDINDIFRINAIGDGQKITEQWKQLIKDKADEREINGNLVLPSVIFSENDFEIVQHYEAKPNFITQKKIDKKMVLVNDMDTDVTGKIVVLENGDPGYDWIFTRDIAGLITKYGGVASHMSIRCAEFGIPAAIGCGEKIFSEVRKSQMVELDCQNGRIKCR
jgi:glutamine kinase